MGSCARLCFYHVSGGVRSKWKLENIAKPLEGRSKTRFAKKKKHRFKVKLGVDLGVILWPARSVFGPGGRSGSIFVRSRNVMQKKVTRVYAGRISRIEFWGGRPFKLSQKRTPKPRSPRPKSKGQKPKEQRNDRKGNRSRSRPGSPVADIYIYIYIYMYMCTSLCSPLI